MQPAPAISPVQTLQDSLGARWDNIAAARERSVHARSKLKEMLEGVDSEDCSVVVSGSLARDEFTPGSDIDWTLLIDGQADPGVIDCLPRIEGAAGILAGKPPGRERTFGEMVFSHDLIHRIGGEDDTNRNTTQRILLLLESAVIGRPDAYERVFKDVLQRYISEDDGFRRRARYLVPRFLQNDFARYWRTMAVDFAYKRRTRFGSGAVIRNLKLRMSRKLIYVSGLLTCFSCELKLNTRSAQSPCQASIEPAECVHCLREYLRMTPLEILASALIAIPHLRDAGKKAFDAYDKFLGLLANPETRGRLEQLKPEEAQRDAVWGEARPLTHDFNDALLDVFFDQPSRLYELTRMYGVF